MCTYLGMWTELEMQNNSKESWEFQILSLVYWWCRNTNDKTEFVLWSAVSTIYKFIGALKQFEHLWRTNNTMVDTIKTLIKKKGGGV